MTSLIGGPYDKTDAIDDNLEGDQGGTGQNAHDLQLEELAMYFHLPISEAAKSIGVCATVLKKICRKNNIPRWPHRKIKSINKMISVLESSVGKNPEDDARIREEIKTLSQHREYVMKNPDSLVQNSKRKRDHTGAGTPAAKRLRREDGSAMTVGVNYGAPPPGLGRKGGMVMGGGKVPGLEGMMPGDLPFHHMMSSGAGGADDAFGHSQPHHQSSGPHYSSAAAAAAAGQLGYPFPSVEMQDWNMRLAQQQQQLAALYYAPLMSSSQSHDPPMQGHDFGHHVGFPSHSAAVAAALQGGNASQMNLNDPSNPPSSSSSADHRFTGLAHPMSYPNMAHPHAGQFGALPQQFMHGLGSTGHMSNLANQASNLGNHPSNLGNHPSNLGNQGNLNLGSLGAPGSHIPSLGYGSQLGGNSTLGSAQHQLNLLGHQQLSGGHHDLRQAQGGVSSTAQSATATTANINNNTSAGASTATGAVAGGAPPLEYTNVDPQMMHMLQQQQQQQQQQNAAALGVGLPFHVPGQQPNNTNVQQGGASSVTAGGQGLSSAPNSNNSSIMNSNESNANINNATNPAGSSSSVGNTPQVTPPPGSQQGPAGKPDWYQGDASKSDYLSLNANEKMGLA